MIHRGNTFVDENWYSLRNGRFKPKCDGTLPVSLLHAGSRRLPYLVSYLISQIKDHITCPSQSPDAKVPRNSQTCSIGLVKSSKLLKDAKTITLVCFGRRHNSFEILELVWRSNHRNLINRRFVCKSWDFNSQSATGGDYADIYVSAVCHIVCIYSMPKLVWNINISPSFNYWHFHKYSGASL